MQATTTEVNDNFNDDAELVRYRNDASPPVEEQTDTFKRRGQQSGLDNPDSDEEELASLHASHARGSTQPVVFPGSTHGTRVRGSGGDNGQTLTDSDGDESNGDANDSDHGVNVVNDRAAPVRDSSDEMQTPLRHVQQDSESNDSEEDTAL